MSLNGYDISDNQGNIDNTQVPGDFVIIKATEGIGYTDPDCDANYQQSKGAGKKLGVYHFARPDGNPNGADEAGWFVSQIQGYIGEAVLVLDLEVNPNPSWAKAFLDRVFELTRVRPLIYMNASTANAHDWSSVWTDYSLWVADYGMNMPQNGYTPSQSVSVNGNWTIAMWQYTSQGRLPGWGSFLDLDVFYGDANAWHAYAQVTEQTPPPVVPPVVAPPVTPPVVPPVEPPVTPPVIPPVVPPVVEKPPVTPVQPVDKSVSPFRKAFLELLRLFVFAVPGVLVQLLTNNPALALGYGAPVLALLRTADAYIHANPNTNLNGLLPF